MTLLKRLLNTFRDSVNPTEAIARVKTFQDPGRCLGCGEQVWRRSRLLSTGHLEKSVQERLDRNIYPCWYVRAHNVCISGPHYSCQRCDDPVCYSQRFLDDSSLYIINLIPQLYIYGKIQDLPGMEVFPSSRSSWLSLCQAKIYPIR